MRTVFLVSGSVVSAIYLAACGPVSPEKSSKFAEGSNGPMTKECIATDIRPQLKDPMSLRILESKESGSKSESMTFITYTATNSFGGRIKSHRACLFREGVLVGAMNRTADNEKVKFTESNFIEYNGGIK